MSANGNRIINDLILPTILFTSAGFFGWAVRGTYGYGAIPGSTFAACCFAITWYLLSKRCTVASERRRYGLGWSIFGIICAIGLNGMHGWMMYQQWDKGIFPMTPGPALSIDPAIGYIWWFIAAVPWTGTGALLLGWSGAKKRYSWRAWVLRIGLGIGGLFAALGFREIFPQLVLPNYILGIYSDLGSCFGCREALEDTGTALAFFGLFAGFLAFEIIQKDWTNVKLALIIGVTTALWWMLFQASNIQHYAWRFFEASAGVGIGVGFGLAFYFCNKTVPIKESGNAGMTQHHNAERLVGVYLALTIALVYALNQALYAIIWAAVGTELDFIPEISIPLVVCGMGLWVMLAIRSIKRPENPGASSAPKDTNIILYLVPYTILRACGFIVTLAEDGFTGIGMEFSVFYILLAAADLVVVYAIKNAKNP
nr:hypothetical protein [Candidatus Sigynarchaeota archaeon]